MAEQTQTTQERDAVHNASMRQAKRAERIRKAGRDLLELLAEQAGFSRTQVLEDTEQLRRNVYAHYCPDAPTLTAEDLTDERAVGTKRGRAALLAYYWACAQGGGTLAELTAAYERCYGEPISGQTMRKAVADLEAGGLVRYAYSPHGMGGHRATQSAAAVDHNVDVTRADLRDAALVSRVPAVVEAVREQVEQQARWAEQAGRQDEADSADSAEG